MNIQLDSSSKQATKHEESVYFITQEAFLPASMKSKSYTKTACRNSANNAKDKETHLQLTLVITNASYHAANILLCDYHGRNPSAAFHLYVAMGFACRYPSFSGPYF